VSAKDLGTGKEQKITITSSSNMSKEDIEKAVANAEQFAAEDKKRREEIDIRNNADQMVYQTEKTLGELGDKVSENEKADLTSKLDALKEALKGEDIEAIKAKQDELQKAFYEISAKLYQQANAQAGAEGAQPGADAGAAGADYVDADFSEVKDDENK
ncbi:MAG: Hsp70 family protein, partial [Oscillospiraceae bacterium]|nr:Hsp70 family protein [Oscillospiraceae bacterium]